MSAEPQVDPFESELRRLFAGFDRPLSPEKIAAYRTSLRHMHEAGFGRVVDFALSEDGPERLPIPKECWRIFRRLQAAARAAVPTSSAPAWKGDAWDERANRRLVHVLMKQVAVRGVSYHSAEDRDRIRATGRVLDAKDCSAETLELHKAFIDAKNEWARVMREWGEPPSEDDQEETWRNAMGEAGRAAARIRKRYAQAREASG